jgi:uncharacterized protein YdbL (DUF1318 family)
MEHIAMIRKLNRVTLGAAVGGVALGLLLSAAPVAAQSPAYAAARAAGQVGEQVDGYLGFPSAPSADVRRTADDVNIKRRAIYAERAGVNHSTVEEYAFTTGCQLILKTKPGEKYQAPDGTWQTRGAEMPLRDSKCPAVGTR